MRGRRKESLVHTVCACAKLPWYITVKIFGLLQQYFGCLSCMPVVYVSKPQGRLPISLRIDEKLLPLLN